MHKTSAPKGFTLIEMVVVMVTLAMIGAAVAAFQRNIVTFNAIIQDDLNGQQELRTGVKNMLFEIRSTAPSSTGTYALDTVASSTLIFYSDLNGDGLRERVRYFLSGKTLKRGVVKPTGSPLTYNLGTETTSDVVHNLVLSATDVFSYYDSSYSGTTAPLTQPVNVLQVRLVRIIMTVDRDPKRAPGPLTITAEATLRNLKDNL